jgi:hypothetical protein
MENTFVSLQKLEPNPVKANLENCVDAALQVVKNCSYSKVYNKAVKLGKMFPRTN